MSTLYKTPEDFGAFAGMVDNRLALKAWLASGGSLGIERFYTTSEQLRIPNNTHIKGVGKNECGIEAHATFPPATQLLLNVNISNDLIVDSNISLEDMSFGGPQMDNTPRATECIALVGVRDWSLKNILIRDWKKDAIVLSNVDNWLIEELEVTRWGMLNHDGGVGQYVGGMAIFCWGTCWNGRIVRPYIHEGAGGIWLPQQDTRQVPPMVTGNGTLVDGAIIKDCVEIGISGGGPGDRIVNCLVDGVKRVDVSGHGMEMHGTDYIVANNIVKNCDGVNMVFTNPARVAILGNNLSNPARRKEGGSCLVVASQGEWAGCGKENPHNLVISGNITSCEDGEADAGIEFVNDNADVQKGKMDNVECFGNILGSPEMWKKRPLQIDPKAQGKRFFVSYSY